MAPFLLDFAGSYLIFTKPVPAQDFGSFFIQNLYSNAAFCISRIWLNLSGLIFEFSQTNLLRPGRA